MAIMASLDDTCLLHRGGLAALETAKAGARAVLAAGGTAAPAGIERLHRLHAELMALWASPGGSADLLARHPVSRSTGERIAVRQLTIGVLSWKH